MINQHNGVYIQYKDGFNNCFDQFQNNNITLNHNIFWDVAENIATAGAAGVDEFSTVKGAKGGAHNAECGFRNAELYECGMRISECGT